MKTIAMFVMATAVAAMLAGCCSSINTATIPHLNGEKLTAAAGVQDVAHINGSTWGLYFFSWPICAGDTNNPGNSSKWFEDTVKLENVVDMVTKKSKEMGATHTVDMNSSVKDFPVFFNFKQAEVSVNAVK